MDFAKVFLFLFLLFLFDPCLSKVCQKPFQCGRFSMDFPFSNVRQPGCGMLKVDGCDSKYPFIVGKGGYEYFIREIVSPTKIKIYDYDLHLSVEKRSCYTPLRNVSLPDSPLISFEISPNITVFNCYKNVSDRGDNPFQKYHSQDCKEFKVFYLSTAEQLSRIPIECGVIQLPAKANQNSTDLFDMLTPEFMVEWSLSEACSRCYQEGGQCLTDSLNEFYCKRDKSRVKLILSISLSGAGAGVGVLLLSLIAYIVRLRKRNVLARNISSNPSDVEDGGSFFGIPVFSYTELEAATNNFDTSKQLGDGAFGTVYYGKLQDGREVAIKRLYEHNYRRMEQFLNEIKILTSLRHPNLVSLYGCSSRRSRELLLVYEYIPNGTVADHLHEEIAKEAPLTWPVRMKIAIETATALAYLHRSDIIHRDVKTHNILLDTNFCVKVADFGTSRLFPENVTHISTSPQGTPGYVDPEYQQYYQLTEKSDVYSFGVVLVELVSSKPAVDIARNRREINLANLALDRIQRCAFDELIDPCIGYGSDPGVTRMTTAVAELAFRCLQQENDLRPSMDEVVTILKDINGGEGCSTSRGAPINIPETDDTDTWASTLSSLVGSM